MQTQDTVTVGRLRYQREVEVETVTYIAGQYFELNTRGFAFYLAAWQDDDADAIQERLSRIESTAEVIIEIVDA